MLTHHHSGLVRVTMRYCAPLPLLCCRCVTYHERDVWLFSRKFQRGQRSRIANSDANSFPTANIAITFHLTFIIFSLLIKIKVDQVVWWVSQEFHRVILICPTGKSEVFFLHVYKTWALIIVKTGARRLTQFMPCVGGCPTVVGGRYRLT